MYAVLSKEERHFLHYFSSQTASSWYEKCYGDGVWGGVKMLRVREIGEVDSVRGLLGAY
jgi:hypothetical protein